MPSLSNGSLDGVTCSQQEGTAVGWFWVCVDHIAQDVFHRAGRRAQSDGLPKHEGGAVLRCWYVDNLRLHNVGVAATGYGGGATVDRLVEPEFELVGGLFEFHVLGRSECYVRGETGHVLIGECGDGQRYSGCRRCAEAAEFCSCELLSSEVTCKLCTDGCAHSDCIAKPGVSKSTTDLVSVFLAYAVGSRSEDGLEEGKASLQEWSDNRDVAQGAGARLYQAKDRINDARLCCGEADTKHRFLCFDDDIAILFSLDCHVVSFSVSTQAPEGGVGCVSCELISDIERQAPKRTGVVSVLIQVSALAKGECLERGTECCVGLPTTCVGIKPSVTSCCEFWFERDAVPDAAGDVLSGADCIE